MKIVNIICVFNIIIVCLSFILREIHSKGKDLSFKSIFNKEILMFFQILIMYFLIKREESSWIILEIMFLAEYIYLVKIKKTEKKKA